ASARSVARSSRLRDGRKLRAHSRRRQPSALESACPRILQQKQTIDVLAGSRAAEVREPPLLRDLLGSLEKAGPCPSGQRAADADAPDAQRSELGNRREVGADQ